MRGKLQTRTALESSSMLVVIVALAILLPAHESQVAALTLIFALAGIGMNILIGVSGLISLGHVAFLAVGAYGWAVISPSGNVLGAFLIPLLISILIAVGIVTATTRVSGYYLGVTTLALGLLSVVVVQNWTSVTNGFGGIPGIQQIGVPGFSGPDQVVVLVGIVLAIMYFLQTVLAESPLGTAFFSMRSDAAATQALGLSLTKLKYLAFVISVIPVTLAGAFLAQLMHYIGPDQFSLETSIQLIAIAIIGGRGWRWAPVLGAIVVITLPELLRPFGDWRLVFYGAALAYVALFMPRGLRQIADNLRHLMSKKKPAVVKARVAE